MEKQSIREVLQSTKFKKVIAIFGIALSVMLVFALGMEIGYVKAGFSYKFGQNYYESFGEGAAHPMGFVPGDVSDAHGVSGKIISISSGGLVIADNDNTEKAVVLDDDTVVRKLRDTITVSDLKVGDFIVVIGDPDKSADIEAKFIRVLPPPATASPASASGTPVTTNQ